MSDTGGAGPRVPMRREPSRSLRAISCVSPSSLFTSDVVFLSSPFPLSLPPVHTFLPQLPSPL